MRIPAVFLTSGLYHLAGYHPYTKRLEWAPHFKFWLGSALGCVVERAYYKSTGRRVGGWVGLLWAWLWLCFVARDLMNFEARQGWVAATRRLAEQNGPDGQLFNYVLYYVGMPSPFDWKVQG